MVYKMNESIIVIQAEATSPNRTNVVFWSHDRGTAKLRMKLVRKDGIPQSLPEGTTVPIRLMFKSATAEGGYGKHDYLATIEDPVNGIVSIVLEDNILGYVGTVEGSVYIDFPDDRSLDTAGRFTFYIKRSPIDDSTPELEDYYFNGFSQTIDKIEKILADGKQEIEQKIAESETQIDAKLKDTNDKITKATQDVATLNTHIDKTDDRIDQANQKLDEVLSGANGFRTDLDTLKITKADKTFVTEQLAQMMTQTEFDSWVATLLDGGPSIFKETYNQLVADLPNGAAGVALVRETDPSHIYVWNPINKYWQDYGQYSGLVPKDESVNKKMLVKSVIDGTDLMETGANLVDTLNTKKNIGSTWVGTTGNVVGCAFSTDLIAGRYRYKIDTTSEFVLPSGSKPSINFKENIFEVVKDTVFSVKSIASSVGSLQIDLLDSSMNRVNSIYVPIVVSQNEAIRTVTITKDDSFSFVKISGMIWTGVVNGEGYFYVYGLDLYYPDEERTNLKKKVTTLLNDSAELKKQVSSLGGESFSVDDLIKKDNKLLVNKGNVLYTFISYDTITKGSAAPGNMAGMNTETPLKLVGDSTGYCDFSKNIQLKFKADNVYGLWFWTDRDVIKKAYSLKVFADSTVIFQSLYTEFNYQNGWNYLTFIPSEDIDSSLIRVEYRVKGEYATDEIPFYIDSIVENRKIKPSILLNMDNSHTNLYTSVYPLLKERDFVGTFAWQMGYYPGSGGVTQEQFNELMANGWDYAMYGYVGTWATDVYDWNQYNTIYTALKSYLDILHSYNISTPVTYFHPNNRSTKPIMKALKSLGFKMGRNSSSYPYIPHYDYDSFELSCIQIQDINSSLQKAKDAIDYAIKTGQSISIFCHDVVDNADSTGVNVSKATYIALLDYIKEKVDAGLVDVITYKQFYEKFVNSIRNISDVDYERLLFRLSKLEASTN